jgi:hypothetical protein
MAAIKAVAVPTYYNFYNLLKIALAFPFLKTIRPTSQLQPASEYYFKTRL